ncbi:LacI family DNA-binding transcriptional regulator [Pengzhenrongella frigida]|uniref:LacI family transcriptional regulator n=1 Tax=Pengzhenrongella frigida TaxID=1259133 RepID=A0A4Q5N1L3_9MICO|nr:LacI family DNA-binding transcriptional regulator [Cellulomonas sp. HLT2-17]RYV51163.1 LacI family transcriptional regulator [Cellulomonas sp. HLT2-17]
MAATTRISDVATAAGVSVGTVSNVLNRPHLVTANTRDRVTAAIESLGFVRNESARQLRAGSSRAIGLVVIDAANPFFADVARGVEDCVDDVGGVVLLGNSGGEEARERRYLEHFEEQRVRGVLIAPLTDVAPPLGALARLGIPVVFLDRNAEDLAHSSVSVDDVAGGRIATEHLIAQGHRRVAFVGGPSTLRQVRDRRQGAEEVVAGTADASLLAISTRGLTVASGRQAADDLVAMPAEVRPTAVFAANDLIAIGLLQGALALGLQVPRDLAIVGYDDIEFAAAAAVPLSSVRQPRVELGRRGAELLFEELAALESGRKVKHQHVRFKPELVVRLSSA